MKYYITTTSEAEQISRDEALDRGCGPITKYWWGWIVDERDENQAALCFDDNQEVSYPTVSSLPDGFLPPEPEE